MNVELKISSKSIHCQLKIIENINNLKLQEMCMEKSQLLTMINSKTFIKYIIFNIFNKMFQDHFVLDQLELL